MRDGPSGASAIGGAGRWRGPRGRGKKGLIAQADAVGAAMGLAVWCHDQAGPFQTVPYPGASPQPVGEPAPQPHASVRNGTAKLLTLFHPADGHRRAMGVTACSHAVRPPG